MEARTSRGSWARWLPLTWLLPREALRAAREKRLMWLVGAMLVPLPLVVDVVSLPLRVSWWGMTALRRRLRGRGRGSRG